MKADFSDDDDLVEGILDLGGAGFGGERGVGDAMHGIGVDVGDFPGNDGRLFAEEYDCRDNDRDHDSGDEDLDEEAATSAGVGASEGETLVRDAWGGCWRWRYLGAHSARILP